MKGFTMLLGILALGVFGSKELELEVSFLNTDEEKVRIDDYDQELQRDNSLSVNEVKASINEKYDPQEEEKHDSQEEEKYQLSLMTEVSIPIGQNHGQEEAEVCTICLEEMKKDEKLFYLKFWSSKKDKDNHLIHIRYYCEPCMEQWLLTPSSNKKCPLCRKYMSIGGTMVDICDGCKIFAKKCLKNLVKLPLFAINGFGNASVFLGPVANIIIPGFLSIPHGFTTTIMYAFMHDIFKLPDNRIVINPMSDIDAFFVTYGRVLPPLFTNIVYMVHDSVEIWGENGFDGEPKIKQYHDPYQMLAMILMPLSFALMRIMPRRDLFVCPPVSKVLSLANFILPYMAQDDFFPTLYFGYLVGESQETIWLLFLANIIAVSYFSDFETFAAMKGIFLGLYLFGLCCSKFYIRNNAYIDLDIF